jgi:hypothetical protein
MAYHECIRLISILYTYLFSIMTSSISEGFLTWYDSQTGNYTIILLTHSACVTILTGVLCVDVVELLL